MQRPNVQVIRVETTTSPERMTMYRARVLALCDYAEALEVERDEAYRQQEEHLAWLAKQGYPQNTEGDPAEATVAIINDRDEARTERDRLRDLLLAVPAWIVGNRRFKGGGSHIASATAYDLRAHLRANGVEMTPEPLRYASGEVVMLGDTVQHVHAVEDCPCTVVALDSEPGSVEVVTPSGPRATRHSEQWTLLARVNDAEEAPSGPEVTE